MAINVQLSQVAHLGSFQFVQGDTLPNILFNLIDEDTGAPKDLTGASAEIRVRNQTTKAPILKQAVNIPTVTMASGIAILQWEVGALDIPEDFYEGELVITFPDGTIETIFDAIEFEVRSKFYD